ncbi:MAG: hypothetical protein ACYC6L_17760, partial [Anaerolineae bacterium]
MLKITRRSLLRLAVLAAASALGAACSKPLLVTPPAPDSASGQSAAFSSEVTFFGGLYHPSTELQNKTSGQPVRQALTELAAAWSDLHPDAKLTFIESPGLMTFNEWMRSQLLLGTGPDCFVTALSFFNFYAANEGVIPLNDSLNLANKYVPEAGKTWRSYFDDLLYVPRGTQGLLGG